VEGRPEVVYARLGKIKQPFVTQLNTALRVMSHNMTTDDSYKLQDEALTELDTAFEEARITWLNCNKTIFRKEMEVAAEVACKAIQASVQPGHEDHGTRVYTIYSDAIQPLDTLFDRWNGGTVKPILPEAYVEIRKQAMDSVRRAACDAMRSDFEKFETYRQQVGKNLWFPAYSRSDESIKAGDERVPIRAIVKWSDFKPIEGTPSGDAPAVSKPPDSVGKP